ncbi:aminotransferase class III-fold pyridoxal phosphate-dependent enzyme [Fodinicola acaciae]|uniref:aminotransferase class III-fold pyridoxal phosphate-dependent enzyme n=1 Tax=Fodinicola acaciae TaxID=2681555 RepID=UPI0013D4819E|nr:aminotransferase class III-fold pyridoxal phosphate-dependent enzyme [Fodinicola acaciae]
MTSFPKVTTELPGPRSREIFERQGRVFYRQMHLSEGSPFILDGKTSEDFLRDVDGNTFANHLSAWGASPYGAFPKEVREATVEAWDRYGMEISCFLQSPPVVELAERLIALAPRNITRVAPTVTGTEAVEGSIKFARERTGRPMVLAFLGQYHGESTYLAATTSTELSSESSGYASYVPGLVFAPYPSRYRAPFTSGPGPHDDTVVIDYIEQWLLRHQVEPTQIGAVLIEPIAGELGVYAPSQAFWDGLERLRRQHGWLLICDEIQSGMGRSGPVWAGDLWGLEPDMLLVGKGFSAGGQPMAAILGTDEIMADSHVYTTGTYVWEPAAVAGALAGLDLLEPARRNALELERIGLDILPPLIDQYKEVGDVRQYGAWAAIEFVTNKETKQPNTAVQAAFHQAALRRGVFGISAPEKWVYRVQPALTMAPELFRWSCEQLVQAVGDVLDS